MTKRLRSLLILAALALGGLTAALAQSTTPTTISGYEVFKGVSFGSTTIGATFAGWTNGGDGSSWMPIISNTGGSWHVSANYSGDPGIGGSVDVSGGAWSLKQYGITRSGRVLKSIKGIQWPSEQQLDLGCGLGVATVNVSIALGNSRKPAGTISGCLNDTHLDTVFPPEVWGSISLP